MSFNVTPGATIQLGLTLEKVDYAKFPQATILDPNGYPFIRLLIRPRIITQVSLLSLRQPQEVEVVGRTTQVLLVVLESSSLVIRIHNMWHNHPHSQVSFLSL